MPFQRRPETKSNKYDVQNLSKGAIRGFRVQSLDLGEQQAEEEEPPPDARREKSSSLLFLSACVLGGMLPPHPPAKLWQ